MHAALCGAVRRYAALSKTTFLTQHIDVAKNVKTTLCETCVFVMKLLKLLELLLKLCET